MSKPTIAILGGTGKEGSGLAFRWAHAGHPVVIGSRGADKAIAAAAELAGGFWNMGAGHSVMGQVEEGYRRRVQALPPDAQQLLFLAAADAVGDAADVVGAEDRVIHRISVRPQRASASPRRDDCALPLASSMDRPACWTTCSAANCWAAIDPASALLRVATSICSSPLT